MLIAYRRYNSGYFQGSERTIESDLPELMGEELKMAEEVRRRLVRGERVRVVGLGEMMAVSMIAVATHFRDGIRSGR